eukprot:scaffold312986_cov41-Tisochrysis_lutea.AAC.2
MTDDGGDAIVHRPPLHFHVVFSSVEEHALKDHSARIPRLKTVGVSDGSECVLISSDPLDPHVLPPCVCQVKGKSRRGSSCLRKTSQRRSLGPTRFGTLLL